MTLHRMFHAYPIEWWAFGCALVAVVVGIVCAYDAHLTRTEVREDTGSVSELYVLATGKVESAYWNCIGQIALLAVAVWSLFLPPPPVYAAGPLVLHLDPVYVESHVFAIRLALSIASLVSVIRDLRVMRVRRRILGARASKRAMIESLASAHIETLAQNVAALNKTLVSTHEESAAIEQETLSTVQDTQQVAIETNDLARSIDQRLEGEHRT